MSNDLQDLKLRIANLRAEELFEIVTFDAADYRSDALELARAELHKRGFTETDVQNWYKSCWDQPVKKGDVQFARMRFAVTLILTGIVTFCLFTPLIYYSIVAYGIPCTIFIVAGYLLWLTLRRAEPQQARAFAIGFAGSVSILLLAYSAGAPWYTGLIVGECMLLWVLFRIISHKNA